jgi:hypothetical protein
MRSNLRVELEIASSQKDAPRNDGCEEGSNLWEGARRGAKQAR